MNNVDTALQFAERLYGSGTSGRGNFVFGTIARTWPDKDYVFIRDDADVTWFTHKSDFTSEHDWNNRQEGQACEFKKIEHKGKKKAYCVSILKEEESTKDKAN